MSLKHKQRLRGKASEIEGTGLVKILGEELVNSRSWEGPVWLEHRKAGRLAQAGEVTGARTCGLEAWGRGLS